MNDDINEGFIQNRGYATTVLNKGYGDNRKVTKTVKWDGTFDGEVANLDIDLETNGKKKAMHVDLTKEDLVDLFSMNPTDMPLDERLAKDFATSVVDYTNKHDDDVRTLEDIDYAATFRNRRRRTLLV